WQQRFKVRFGFTPPCWHNGITPKSRRILWQQAATGALSVVVGARSALHLPFATLGLIVLDEEHDFSYKQDDGIPYHARDMAVVRAQHHRIPLVLVSATPSLESLENARRSKYRHVLLPIRYQAVALPDISLIDTRQHRPAAQDWLSPPLIAALHQTLTAQQQAVLFLNRRGFAPLLLCRNCGYRFHCPECDVNLTEHRYPQRHLNCHHCGFTVLVPKQCPNCQHPDHLSSAGPGVERIIDNLQQHLPNARTFVATADTLDTPAAVSAFLEAMQNRAIDIVVGTQIIAKGFDFPYLTLAGVIDADQALFGSNPRASEQTWQLLHQIAGRTGRHHLPGRALLQTQNPDDIVFQSLKKMDRNAFFAQQRRVRKAASMPPFGRLLALIIQSRNARLAETTAHTLAKHSPSGMHRLLGPLPAPISRLRGWYRQRLLLLAPRQIALQPIAQTMITRTKIPANVRLKVDVDPYNFV
ncbi:MAG: primosomal protein N', partial [Alphaproteobacteria bacterium]|nr:primosomal protein N' [Alphaproteobacteria bacterium]